MTATRIVELMTVDEVAERMRPVAGEFDKSVGPPSGGVAALIASLAQRGMKTRP